MQQLDHDPDDPHTFFDADDGSVRFRFPGRLGHAEWLRYSQADDCALDEH
ncbi:MAG TPA: hypothetical protein PKM36_09875 [Propionibacteriaceae bacterium]|nr:hypothetical protein [Propionibacteriaceae bacterium]